MKLLFTSIFIFLLLTGCDMGSTFDEMAKKNPDAKARMIAADYGCLSCHTVDNSVVGPAWRLVAKRYQGDADIRGKLINSIKHGSRGQWNVAKGEKMPAFVDRMSDEEIGVMIDYIIGLNVEPVK